MEQAPGGQPYNHTSPYEVLSGLNIKIKQPISSVSSAYVLSYITVVSLCKLTAQFYICNLTLPTMKHLKLRTCQASCKLRTQEDRQVGRYTCCTIWPIKFNTRLTGFGAKSRAIGQLKSPSHVTISKSLIFSIRQARPSSFIQMISQPWVGQYRMHSSQKNSKFWRNQHEPKK